MKSFVAFLAAACLVHSCYAFRAQECLATPSTECSDVSTLQIEVIIGKCSGTAKASCTIWASSESNFKDAFKEWWRGADKVCNGDARKGAAKAVANEIAQIWRSAAEDVECSDDPEFPCGWSFATGETFGQSVAEVVAKAAADASLALGQEGDEDGANVADSFCFADVRTIAGAMAQAASSALADACAVCGERATVYQVAFASAMDKVVEDAFASATSSVCTAEGGADAFAASECTGSSASVDGTLFGGPGDFCAETPTVRSCKSVVEERCCADESKDRCIIARRECRDCRSPYWRFERDGSILFRDRDGDVCLCN